MCYSAQVIQAARKMYRQLGIRLDYDEAEKLFFRRLDDPTLNISRGFETNFDEPTTDQARRIKSAIGEHRSRMAGKIEKDLFTQKTRLVTADRSLKTKETKKSREDVRIATTKIASLTEKLSDLRRSEPKARDNCRHQHSLSFISVSMSSKSGLCRSKSQLRRLKALFLLFGAARHPRIATSTTDKNTDGDNHY